MNELEEIAAASQDMLTAFDKWLATPQNAEPEAKKLMETRNLLAIKLNAYNKAFKDLLTDQENEQ